MLSLLFSDFHSQQIKQIKQINRQVTRFKAQDLPERATSVFKAQNLPERACVPTLERGNEGVLARLQPECCGFEDNAKSALVGLVFHHPSHRLKPGAKGSLLKQAKC
ncbi:MAG: hypothetical protein P9X24_12625 [Candidatus Hatepunaea meridiana]|nr:hypothetical protein [Candidatus Hatepunaea meridiana]